MWGVFKGHMGPPSYVVHVWESCQDKLTTKYIRGKLLTDNVSGYMLTNIMGVLIVRLYV